MDDAKGTLAQLTRAAAAQLPPGDRLVWLDLEMTGLDPAVDRILQVGCVITTFDDLATELESMEMTLHAPPSALETMVPVVREMHTRSGLLEKVERSAFALEDAERELMGRIIRQCPYRAGYLAGNSVWVDRMFLRTQLPVVEGYLHHRMVDVTSVSLMAEVWGGITRPSKHGHTALEDVRTSISALREIERGIRRA